MKRRGTNNRRQLDWSRIKNFLPCRETAGATEVKFMHGGILTDAALGFVDNGVTFTSGTSATGDAVTGEGLQDLTSGVDTVAIYLIKANDLGASSIVNFQIGNIPRALTTDHNYHFGGGEGDNNVGVQGSGAGQGEAAGGSYALGDVTRIAVKCNYGVKYEVSTTGEGVDASFSDMTTIPADGDLWDDVGEVSTFKNEWFLGLNNGSLTMYAMQMAEFPDGLPDDIDARINKAFTLWEAGNKTPMPVYDTDTTLGKL